MDVSRSPRSVLVTGGCGFIGSNFVNHIAKEWPGATIINYDILMPAANGCNVEQELRLSDKYHLVIGDIKNRQLVKETLEKYKVDMVINFAANSHVDECYKDPIGSARNNVIGMTHFLEVCREYGQLSLFLHISSDEVYGDSQLGPNAKPKTEDVPLVPTNTYAASKASCEALLNSYKISYKIPTIVVRMNNVYGPRQWATKGPNYNMVVPCFIREAVEDKAFTLMHGGTQLRSWMHIDDCCKGIQLVTEKGQLGQVYNLGTNFELSIKDLAKAIHSEVNKQKGTKTTFTTTEIKDRPYNDARYYIDTNKIEKEVGWKCQIPFNEGLAKTVAWYMVPKRDSLQEHVLIYGGKGWIGEQFCQMFDSSKVSYILGQTRPGKDRDETVENEIIQVAPSHILCLTGRTQGPGCGTIQYLEGGPDKLMENVRDNLYCPWILASLCQKLGIHLTYIGTGCIFEYDDKHTVGGPGYKENDEPNYFGMSYSVVKGHTDRIMHQYEDTVLNARIRLPVNFENDKRNLLAKIINYSSIFDIPNSITVLPDIMPIIYDLMHRRYTGTLNMTSPGAIRHSYSLKLFKELVDPKKNWEFIHEDQPEAEKMRHSRANCTLDTTKLEEMYPKLRSSEQAMRRAVIEIGKKMKMTNSH